MFIDYKCKTKNVEWIRIKKLRRKNIMAFFGTVYIFVAYFSNINPYPSIFKQQNNDFFTKKTVVIILVYLPNLSIFKLIDSKNENMLVKNYFGFEIFTSGFN